MKQFICVAATLCVLGIPFIPERASALSCLPIDTYLKDVVGKDEIVIFTGTQINRSEETDYTREQISVHKALQGYLEKELFVYHQKHSDWGYLCNTGPDTEKGSTGVYIAERDAFGKYNVYQRIEPGSVLFTSLEAELAKKDITGQINELSATDRANQIMSTIEEMIRHIMQLLKEYAYLKNTQ